MSKQVLSGYNPPLIAGKSTVTSISTSETTLLEITNTSSLRGTSLTNFLKITFGGSTTSVKIKYYLSPDNGTTYYQVPAKSSATGILADLPSVIDSTSPSPSAGVYQLVDSVKLYGGFAIKITGTAVGAAATLDLLEATVTDN